MFERARKRNRSDPNYAGPVKSDNEPRIPLHLFLHWRAFNELNRRRAASANAIFPLQFSEIAAWLAVNEIHDYELAQDITASVCAIDDFYIQRSLNPPTSPDVTATPSSLP